MPFEVAFMLVFIVATLVVFALEIFPIEVTAMGMLGLLILLGFIEPQEAVAGLSNKAVVTIGALFVVSRALVKTGILEIGAFWLSQRVRNHEWLGITVFLIVTALLSGFLNNTAVVAIFIPLALSLSKRFRISPSKILLPLSYVAIFGGMITVIGTSTNLLVSSLAERAGQPPIRMFEFIPLAAILLVLGLTYVVIAGRRSLPERTSASSLATNFNLASYLVEVQVPADSRLIGRTCRDVQIRERYGLTVVAILRGETDITKVVAFEPIQEGDILIIEGNFDDVLRLRNDQKVSLLPGIEVDERNLTPEGHKIGEALVPVTSRLIGKTLKESDFGHQFNALVLALRRHGETLYSRLADTPLRASDCLLLMTTPQRLTELRYSDNLQVVSELETSLHRERFWWLPLVLFPTIVLLAVSGMVEILEAAVLGAILLLLLGVLKNQEAYRSIEWSVLFLIAAFVPVGTAMERTGTADFIAHGILSLITSFPAEWHGFVGISLIYLITSLLTQMVSNNASAIILTPVALSLASSLSLNPRPFLIAICFAASAEFMTPMGYQTNMMVYGPGGYRFMDYVRFGAPLNLCFWILASLLIPLIWPLTPLSTP
ncbi:MAG: SLC13 family permease [Acidobacteriota bacterium]